MRSGFSIIVVAIALSLLGLLMLPSLPVKLFPSGELPSLTVSFSMPGVSSRIVEQDVTSRVEGALARVKGVRKIQSRSSQGRGSVTISLDRHADVEKTRMEVSMIMRQLWDAFPTGVSYPVVSARRVNKESQRPFMTYTVSSPAFPMEIEDYIERKVAPRLSDIHGVADVSVHGAYPMEWNVEYDADALSAAGLSPQDIVDAIRRHYGSEFLGISQSGGVGMRVVRQPLGGGGIFDPSLITVTTPGGETVALDRLVTVRRSEGSPDSYFRINGLNSIYLNITAEESANQIDTSDAVKKAMKGISEAAPEGMRFILDSDRTDSIREELDKIYFRTGLTVLILLLFIMAVTRDFRYTLLIVISLAMNLAIALILYRALGTEIHLYSLAGITISLNLIIDNTIVMCDHYMRRRDRRAFPSILAATLTTAGALVVVFLLDEKVRLNLGDFVVVVIVNLAVSLLVALFLVPALADRMGVRLRHARERRRWQTRICRLMRRAYGGYVRFAVRWRWAFFLLMAAVIGISGWIFFQKVREGDYLDRDRGEIVLFVNASLPNGATLAQMDALIRGMEAYVAGFDGVRQFETNVYSGQQAMIAIRFTEKAEGSGVPYMLKSDIISKALTLGGGSWNVYGLDDSGFSNDVRESSGGFRVRLTGFNYDELMARAMQLRDSLLTHRRIKEVEIKSDFSYWKEDYSEFYLRIDRGALMRAGLTAGDFYEALHSVFGRRLEAGTVDVEGHSEPIRLSSAQSGAYDVWALMNVVMNIGGKRFRLSDVAALEKGDAPQDIVKENQSYRICLQYDYIGSDERGGRLLDKELEAFNAMLPAGYKAERESRGQTWDEKDFSRYWLLAVVALIIFFLSAILFNSLLRPLAIIAVIPMSYVGIFLTFRLFDLKFDQGGFASFILLSGITVNAAIYIINEYDGMRKTCAGRTLPSCYLDAFRVKIMPVLMTVLSTVLGFVPFLVGTEREGFWFPLAAGTIGGLLFSMVAIVLYLPLLILPAKSMRRRRKPIRG